MPRGEVLSERRRRAVVRLSRSSHALGVLFDSIRRGGFTGSIEMDSMRRLFQKHAQPFGRAFTFAAILASFGILALLSWPILFSLDLWVFKDRGNLLNLDYLLDMGLRPGVDTYYSYGLLPVLIQHYLFAEFGRGYWPMLACTLVYYVVMAGFWTLVLARLPHERIWFFAVIAMIPILLWVNPNFPYCLVVASMSFALLLVLEGRFDLAFAVSAIGAVSVESLPLVLAALLFVLIVIERRLGQDHSLRVLIRRLVPGGLAFLLLAGLLTAVFGWRSMLATALPLQGAKFYKAAHVGFLTTGMEFLYPMENRIPHFIFGRPAWWIASSILLVIFGSFAAVRMIRRRSLDPAEIFVLLCALIHVVFVSFAYGSPTQHVVFDPLLAAGVLVGIAMTVPARLRAALLAVFVGLGVLSHGAQARATWLAWRGSTSSATTAGLYADAAWAAEWSKILNLASRNRLLLLSYGTGVHHYFPSVESPNVWYLQIAQLFPSDKQRVLTQMKGADVLVEDLSGATIVIDSDPAFRRELDSLCLTDVTANFQIWRRHPPGTEAADCKTNPRAATATGG
ncbi:MAG: hypothetical protein ACR2KT_08400 [Methylocella sp.]